MLKAVIQNLVFIVILGLLLFLPAGTLAWPQGWTFLALFVGCSHATGFWLLKTNPELLAERMKSPFSADQRPRDRAIIVAIMVFLCVWLVFMPLDGRRFSWSHTPLWAQVIGAALIVGAFMGWVCVLRANSFASVKVRVQRERGQTVISTGPYAVVRHPMYSYVLLLLIGTPLLLGSLWGLLGVVVVVPLLAARALGEEEGYSWTGCRATATTPPRCASVSCQESGEASELDQSAPQPLRHRLRPAARVELGEHRFQVELDRMGRDPEAPGDLLVARSLADRGQDLHLARRQQHRRPLLLGGGETGRLGLP